MNKELIKKYKKEFDHWLNGGEVLFFYWGDWYSSTYNPKMVFNHINPDDVKCYVINDEYATYRKASAEGKVVEVATDYNDVDGYIWKSMEDKEFHYFNIDEIRIKPEEPQFKAGNWVVHPDANAPWKLSQNSIDHLDNSKLELWQPQPGEWCWFLNKGKIPVISQFHSLEIEGNRKYSATFPNTPHPMIGYYEYCEPFIGNLPTLSNK